MNGRQIFYEANLQNTGKSLKRGAVVLVLFGAVGFSLVLFAEFSGKVFVLLVLGIFISGVLMKLSKFSKWSQKPGSYQIYLDSIGFHVHSDAPALGEPFSIATLNLHQLIRKRVGNGEDLEYEYFVEEKSGKRHQISVTLANYNLNVMDLFESIACEFPSVKIVNE